MTDVLFLRAKSNNIPCNRLQELVERSGWLAKLTPKMLVALKLHFGEQGNQGQIAPKYVAAFVSVVKQKQAKPFLTETSTLYVGQRANAYDHFVLAYEHGYTYEKVGAPIIMADGLRGQARATVKIKGLHHNEVMVASDTRVYDALLVLTHITGHGGTGLGGTIKNVGMGLVSRAGKRMQHSAMKPKVAQGKCIACNRCFEWCPTGAIQVRADGSFATVDHSVCIGCGECLAVCPPNAVSYDWNAEGLKFQERLAEHALGVVTGRQETTGYVSFLTSITRNCDCMGKDNKIYFDDIGVITSTDPVALDQAAVDLIKDAYRKDFFQEQFPDVDYTIQLKHGEKIGLGNREYKLVQI